ncbi:hypothetical protein Dimus_008097 [Dionaea muscipula]
MKNRGRRSRKPSAADLLSSPSPMEAAATAIADRSSPGSPKSFEFKTTATAAAFNIASSAAAAGFNRKSAAPPPQLKSSPSPALTTLSSVSELKEMASSRLDSIKRQVDLSHPDFLKEMESSQSRLHKRFKIQAQACQQVMDQVEKEQKKISERIRESREAVQASYAEIIAEAQASASRVCKTSIPDLALSFEKAIDGLRSRYGISAASH